MDKNIVKEIMYIAKYGTPTHPKYDNQGVLEGYICKTYYTQGQIHFVTTNTIDPYEQKTLEKIYDPNNMAAPQLIAVSASYPSPNHPIKTTTKLYNNLVDYSLGRYSQTITSFRPNQISGYTYPDHSLYNIIPEVVNNLPDDLSNQQPDAIIDTTYYTYRPNGTRVKSKLSRTTRFDANADIHNSYNFVDTYLFESLSISDHPIYDATSAMCNYTITKHDAKSNPTESKAYCITIPYAKKWIADKSNHIGPDTKPNDQEM